MCFTFKKNNKQTKKPVNCFLQDDASAGIQSLQTSIVTKLQETDCRGVNLEQKSHLLAAGRWSTYGANIDRQVHWFIVASAWSKNKLVTGKGN